MNTDAQIKAAIELLNKNNYIAIPIGKGQMFLTEGCTQKESECRYCSLGYTCSNLICLNKYISGQLDMSQLKDGAE